MKPKLALVPKDLDCVEETWVVEEKNYPAILRIAEKRTHRFALECIRPGGKITIKEVLAAAYIQGMSDAAKLSTGQD